METTTLVVIPFPSKPGVRRGSYEGLTIKSSSIVLEELGLQDRIELDRLNLWNIVTKTLLRKEEDPYFIQVVTVGRLLVSLYSDSYFD